jgi:hypothetical protein
MVFPRPRTLVLMALTCVASCAAVVGCWYGLLDLLDPFAGGRFDHAAWAAGRPEERAPMARDLVRHHLPVGLPAARVRELLGVPDPFPGVGGGIDGFGTPLRSPETWAHYLGSWSWQGLDSAFLYVHFGPDGEVVGPRSLAGSGPAARRRVRWRTPGRRSARPCWCMTWRAGGSN